MPHISKSSRKRKDTTQLIINIPVGNENIEYIDDYNLLDLTVKQAMEYPNFSHQYNSNCKNTLKTRMKTMIDNGLTLTKYTNDEAGSYCKCSLNKLGRHKIRDILNIDTRKNIQLSDCVKHSINTVKSRLLKSTKGKASHKKTKI